MRLALRCVSCWLTPEDCQASVHAFTSLPAANLLKGDKRSSKKNSHAGPGDTQESLFHAILNQDLAKVQSLVESLEVGDLNGRTEEGFTPLDLAVMCESPAISRLLQSHGARDSQQCE